MAKLIKSCHTCKLFMGFFVIPWSSWDIGEPCGNSFPLIIEVKELGLGHPQVSQCVLNDEFRNGRNVGLQDDGAQKSFLGPSLVSSHSFAFLATYGCKEITEVVDRDIA